MNGKHVVAAATDRRTVPWLLLGAIPAAIAFSPVAALIGVGAPIAVAGLGLLAGLGAHAFATKRLLSSTAFQHEMERNEMGAELYAQLGKIERLAKTMDPRLKSILPFGEKRSLWVRKEQMKERARAVYREWKGRPEQYYEHFRNTQLALQLAEMHLRLLHSYQAIWVKNGPVDLGRFLKDVLREVPRVAGPRATQPIQMVGNLLGIDLGPERPDREKEAYLETLSDLEAEVDRLHRRFFTLERAPEGERVRDLLVEARAWEEALQEVNRRQRVRVR
jgi:uncharacterized protein YacL (UPF0231 family)